MRSSNWAAPPQRLDLPDGAIDVWRAQVADRRAARAILRLVLSRYLNADPGALRFELGPHGKPALASAESGIRFNMSHTRGLALYAVALSTEVGVDVEHPGRSLDAVRMARRFIGVEEAERLEQLAPERRGGAFLRAWVRHEATVKCLGTGIGGDAGGGATEPPPWVADLDPGGGAAAAVAAADGPHPLRLWQWLPLATGGGS